MHHRARNSSPASALIMGITFCIFFFVALFGAYDYIGTSHVAFMPMVILSLIFLALGIVLISIAIYFVRRRGFRWRDHFIPEVTPRKTGVSQPSYDVDRPNQGLTKICPACEHKIASDSKVCPNCGELFVDLAPG